jgi:hypothetical protein
MTVKTGKKIRETMTTPKTELSFPASTRPGARYVSDTAVCEEALEHGRWIGLY